MKHLFTITLFLFSLPSFSQIGLGPAGVAEQQGLDGEVVASFDTTYVIYDDFDFWSGGANPNAFPSRTVLSGNDATNFWDETNSTGGAGTGHALISSAGADINIRYDGTVVPGTEYHYKLDITGGTDVDLQLASNGSTQQAIANWTTTGVKEGVFTPDAGNVNVQLKRLAGNSNTVTAYLYVYTNGYHSAATTLFANAVTAGSAFDDQDKVAISTWIQHEDDDGNWAETDVMWVFEVDTETQSLLNWKNSAFDATESGTITFLADVGIRSDGSSYYNTNFQLSDGTQFLLNDNSAHVYSATSGAAAAVDYFIGMADNSGTEWWMAARHTGDLARLSNYSAGQISPSNTTTNGLFSGVRTGVSSMELFLDNSSLGSGSGSSVSPESFDFYISAFNNRDTAGSFNSTKYIGYVVMGSSSINIAELIRAYTIYSKIRD